MLGKMLIKMFKIKKHTRMDTMNREKSTKISIIIPVYNVEKYIEKCIKSIVNQTYSNLEIIVVNDGSLDNSWKVITAIAKTDSRIIPINKKNGGATSARMEGIKIASGGWIGFVDGDDEIESDMYEFLLANAIKYHASISHCGYQMMFQDGRIHYFYNTGKIVQQDRAKGIEDLLCGEYIEPGLWNKLYKKELFDSLIKHSIPYDIKINEDLLMNYFLFSKAQLSVFEDQCKYHYIVRENSASRSNLNEHKIFDPIRVKQLILENTEDEFLNLAKKAYINTCVNVYSVLTLEEKQKYILEKKRIRTFIKNNKRDFKLLKGKRKILVYIISYFPCLYHSMYGIYCKFFQKSKYE